MTFWYKNYTTWQALLLLPLAKLVEKIARRKRNNRISASYPVPILVVGNITVGGTGKTPMILWLVKALKASGLTVAVVSRGYGAKPNRPFPIDVSDADTSVQVGDEPKLIHSIANVRVVIDPNRDQAVQFLLEEEVVPDVIISDDGMQHYAMHRDLEILMLDGERIFGNGHLLPAGPLREPVSRLNTVDFKIVKSNNLTKLDPKLNAEIAVVKTGQPINRQGDTISKGKVVLCSGIGNYNSFKQSVLQMGFEIVREHRFQDHEAIPPTILADATFPILVTEKDMIKITGQFEHVFAVPIELQLNHSTRNAILKKIEGLRNEKSRHYSSKI